MRLGAFLKIGDVIAGKYRVEAILGQGGMGLVVAARHLGLGERRAIKFMLPDASHDAEAVERFRREARAASRLKSTTSVTIYDIDSLKSGVLYIVMEHLEGEDLKALLEKRRLLPLEEACHYAKEAAIALAEAHKAGIIHRDIKLGNLFLAKDARGERHIKILDFGIAKITGNPNDPALTRTRAALGSPAFMSPEQIRGAREADARTDIWSLGVVLYKLTTGILPFEARSVNAIFANILAKVPVMPPSSFNAALPPAFDALVLHCLERDREARLATMNDLAKALEPFASYYRPARPEELDAFDDGPTEKLPSISEPSVPKRPFSSRYIMPAPQRYGYSREDLAAIPADPNLSAPLHESPTSLDLAPRLNHEASREETGEATTEKWKKAEEAAKEKATEGTLPAAKERPARRARMRTVKMEMSVVEAATTVEAPKTGREAPVGKTIPMVYLVVMSALIGVITGALGIWWVLERSAASAKGPAREEDGRGQIQRKNP